MTQPRARRWPTRTATQVLADRVRRFRDAHGWSARELALRCTAAGVPLDRSVIANLENGRRVSVSVQELLTLAHVLSIPPVLLFLPVGEDYRVEVTPGVVLAPDAAVRWFCGEAMMPGDPNPGIWQRFARPLHLYRQLDDAHAERWNAESAVRRADAGSDQDQRDALEAYAVALVNVATVLSAMVEDGMTVPPLKDYNARDMVKLGVALPPGVPVVATSEKQLV